MNKLTNIQILRAFAALAVVLYHSGIESTTVCETTGLGCVIDLWIGGYGVGLFFVISGFIMVATSWNGFGSGTSALDFMRRRIVRIVPLYWLVTTIGVIGIWFVPSMLKVSVLEPFYILSSYLFWPVARENGLMRPIATLGWTLNLEMMFYLVFAVALMFSRARGLFLAMAFLTLLSVLQMLGVFSPSGALPSLQANFWGDPIILNFIIGMIIAVFYMQGARITATQSKWLLAASAATALVTYRMDSWLLTFPDDHVVPRMVLAVPSVALFLAGALGPQVDVKKAGWRFAHLLGDASYSIYLIHPFVLRVLTKVWSNVVGTALPVGVFTVLCIASAIAVGLVSYFLAERPMQRYFSKRKVGKPAMVLQAQPAK